MTHICGRASNTQHQTVLISAHWSIKRSSSTWCADGNVLSWNDCPPTVTLMLTTKNGICSLERIPLVSLLKTGWNITKKPTRYQQGASISTPDRIDADQDIAHQCSHGKP